MKHFGWLLVVLFCGQPSGAQPLVPKSSITQLEVLKSIYGHRFDQYESQRHTLALEKNVYTLLELFHLRWRFVPVAYSSENNTYYNLLVASLDKLENDKQTTAAVVYLKICNLLFLSEYHSSLGQTWQAVKYAQRAYPLIVESFEKKYSDPEFLFVHGLYNYYIEYYRHKNFFFRATFLPFRTGDKDVGLRQLKDSAHKPSMAQIESQLFLAHILLHLENKPTEALVFSEGLVRDYPLNPKFRELHAETLVACKRYQESRPYVEEILKSNTDYFKVPGYYLMGVIEEEQNKNSAAAVSWYKKCIEKEFKPLEYFQQQAQKHLDVLE